MKSVFIVSCYMAAPWEREDWKPRDADSSEHLKAVVSSLEKAKAIVRQYFLTWVVEDWNDYQGVEENWQTNWNWEENWEPSGKNLIDKTESYFYNYTVKNLRLGFPTSNDEFWFDATIVEVTVL